MGGFAMNFSDRLRGHGQVTVKPTAAREPKVLAIKNQLLVRTKPWESPDPADAVHAFLESEGVPYERITTLLYDIAPPTVLESEDVEILHLDLRRDPRGRDIFGLTGDIRAELDPVAGSGGGRSVSPNHILVPANEDHSCPYGPPWPSDEAGVIAPVIGPTKNVVIIDSGYQWNSAWGANPLDAYAGGVTFTQSERLADPGGWVPGTPDTLDAGTPGTLGALSGHANFIAGVIVQNSQHAKITVLNHNGAFRSDGDDLPTEAKVVRSLCRCAVHDPDVINLGFAFKAFDDVVSCAWDIGRACISHPALANDAVVVTPAGNQNSPDARYPAALNHKYAGAFQTIIAVGSTAQANDPTLPEELRKPFSNYGDWVTCSTDGALVLSTFLKVEMPVEDLTLKKTNFGNAWARWSGTSFATPKIVAKIVNVMVERELPPLLAWEWLRDNEGGAKTSGLGHRFP
jgi:thermitase